MTKSKNKESGRGRKRRGIKAPTSRYTREDRELALGVLDDLLDSEDLAKLHDALHDEFYGETEHLPAVWSEQIRDDVETQSAFAFLWWACFDAELSEDDPRTLAEYLLEQGELPLGARRFIESVRSARMRLYEVVVTRPGLSVTLRDALERGPPIRVRERSASEWLVRSDLVAARIVPGPSESLELDGGLFCYGDMQRDAALSSYELELRYSRKEDPEASEDIIRRRAVPVLHHEWRSFEMPTLQNFDGEGIVPTRVVFEFPRMASRTIAEGLDALHLLERTDSEGAEPQWSWFGTTEDERVISLGWIELAEKELVLHTNSRERAEIGRAMLTEQVPGLHHVETDHQSIQEMISAHSSNDGVAEQEELSARPEVREAISNLLDNHQRSWLDEHIPALDGCTPREAARDGSLRPRLLALLDEQERHYERQIRQGSPAADPGWLRKELGLHEPFST